MNFYLLLNKSNQAKIAIINDSKGIWKIKLHLMEVYEIVKSIGSGSFGQVYIVRHRREEKNYVIKKIKTKDMSQKDRENTENEVRLL